MRTGKHVEQVLMEDGRAAGVVLRNGKALRAGNGSTTVTWHLSVTAPFHTVTWPLHAVT